MWYIDIYTFLDVIKKLESQGILLNVRTCSFASKLQYGGRVWNVYTPSRCEAEVLEAALSTLLEIVHMAGIT